MKEVIMKVPSFSADYPKAPIYVAELVRCGECIYWKNSLCQAWHRVIPKDGYCSIGERDRSTQFDKINNIPVVESNNSEIPNNCETCKYGEDKHRYAHICNECGVGINNYEPKTEPQYDIDKGTIKCDNCSENGSYKCSKCDGEIYFKRLEVEDDPQTEREGE